MVTSPTELSAREAVTALREGSLDPADLVAATIAAAREHAALDQFVTIDEEAALRSAAFSARRISDGRAREIEGLPVPVKDVEPTRGLRTTYGSPIHAEHVPDFDGGAAAALRDAGAIIFGKTNTSSFAHLDDSVNLLGLATRNPVDPTRSAGGSSGGAASAVAAGVCRVAHASDGAGSVRLPAALCGVVGFKPTYGLIPRWPVSDQWNGRSHHGVIARTVDDVAVGLTGLCRYDARDPLTVWHQEDWLGVRSRPRPARPLRLGYLPSVGDAPVDGQVEKTVRAAAEHLIAETGRQVEVVGLGSSQARLFDDIYAPQVHWDLRDQLEANGDLLEDTLVDPVSYGAQVTMSEYLGARQRRGEFNQQLVETFADMDFLLTPAAPCVAWPLDVGPTADGRLLSPALSDRQETLLIANLTGWPAISVPCGETADGYPVGLQILAPRGRDVDVLGLAYLAEGLFT